MNKDLDIPAGLSPEGVEAATIVQNWARTVGGDYTGGSRAFWTPEEWLKHETSGDAEDDWLLQDYMRDAVLVVMHDGGCLSRYNSGPSWIQETRADLEAKGFVIRPASGWYTIIAKENAKTAAMTPEDDVKIVELFPKNPTEGFYRMVFDALNLDSEGLEGEALAQGAVDAVVGCKNEEDLDVLVTILEEINAHGDINKNQAWSEDAYTLEGDKRSSDEGAEFEYDAAVEVDSLKSGDDWTTKNRAVAEAMQELRQVSGQAHASFDVVEVKYDGTEKDLADGKPFFTAFFKLKLRTSSDVVAKLLENADNFSGEIKQASDPDFAEELKTGAEIPDDMHPDLHAFGDTFFNVNAPENMKANIGKYCATKQALETLKHAKTPKAILTYAKRNKVPYGQIDALEIKMVQKIYDGSLAYRVHSPIYDPNNFGMPARPDEIEILTDAHQIAELRNVGYEFAKFLNDKERDDRMHFSLPENDPRYPASMATVPEEDMELSDQDKQTLRGMGIRARLRASVRQARAIKAISLTTPSAVLQQFRPDLLGEQVQYPEAQHQTPAEGVRPPHHEDGNKTLERTQKGLSGVSPSEQLDGPPMRKELNLHGPSFTDNFYKAQDNLSPSMFHASKHADSDPQTPRMQFETMLKQILATFTASAIGMFQSSQRPVPFDGQNGTHTVNLGEFAASNSHDMSGKFDTFMIAVNRVREMAEALKADEIREALDSAWAQAAVWCNDDGGFLYEIYASGDSFDPKTLAFTFKYLTGKKGDLKLASVPASAKVGNARCDYTAFDSSFAVPDDIPTTFVDDSWDVDTCPSFINAPAGQKLWIEHPDRNQREDQDASMKRFTLTNVDDRSQTIFETDDWDEMKQYIQNPTEKAAAWRPKKPGVAELEAKIGAETDKALKQIHSTLRAKGYDYKRSLQSAQYIMRFMKGTQKFEINGWHGTGQGNRWYGDLRTINDMFFFAEGAKSWPPTAHLESPRKNDTDLEDPAQLGAFATAHSAYLAQVVAFVQEHA